MSKIHECPAKEMSGVSTFVAMACAGFYQGGRAAIGAEPLPFEAVTTAFTT